jgi:hypothetical protein
MSIKSKKRIYVSVSSEVEEALEQISKKQNTPIASAASVLLQKAIEHEEDEIWEVIIEKRKNKNKKYYSHKQAWN